MFTICILLYQTGCCVHIHYCHKYKVIVCILTVQILTTVLHKLPLYWAIEGTKCCHIYVWKNAFIFKAVFRSSLQKSFTACDLAYSFFEAHLTHFRYETMFEYSSYNSAVRSYILAPCWIKLLVSLEGVKLYTVILRHEGGISSYSRSLIYVIKHTNFYLIIFETLLSVIFCQWIQS